MQVNSSVNTSYYTSYQRNMNVKYGTGFIQTEDGGFIPNEITKNSGFAEFMKSTDKGIFDYSSTSEEMQKELMVANKEIVYEKMSATSASVREKTAEKGFTTYYNGKSLEEWSETDPKYTDKNTGISYYVRDGKYPYMTDEDVTKLKELCAETGEPWLKKMAEITGNIQYLNDNTVAYIGDNGTAIKSKDGKELFIDTSSLSYDMLIDMFSNLSMTDDYLNEKYWSDNISNIVGHF